MPTIIVCLKCNNGKLTANDNLAAVLALRQFCEQAGLPLLTHAADGAKAEFKAQEMLLATNADKRLIYEHPQYGVKFSCPVWNSTGPFIPTIDMPHLRKTVRNNFCYGTHLLTIGEDWVCHAILMELLKLDDCPLYMRDVYNPEKQDDGAARRLFLPGLLSILVNENGELLNKNFRGFFVLGFVFGASVIVSNISSLSILMVQGSSTRGSLRRLGKSTHVSYPSGSHMFSCASFREHLVCTRVERPSGIS